MGQNICLDIPIQARKEGGKDGYVQISSQGRGYEIHPEGLDILSRQQGHLLQEKGCGKVFTGNGKCLEESQRGLREGTKYGSS